MSDIKTDIDRKVELFDEIKTACKQQCREKHGNIDICEYAGRTCPLKVFKLWEDNLKPKMFNESL